MAVVDAVGPITPEVVSIENIIYDIVFVIFRVLFFGGISREFDTLLSIKKHEKVWKMDRSSP